ncbi:MAG: hypothetical protein ACTSUE_03940 [Promethearchaeota archaeon]
MVERDISRTVTNEILGPLRFPWTGSNRAVRLNIRYKHLFTRICNQEEFNWEWFK